ncbi:MAG: hypothetical protein CSA26_07830 [Desulfobacterales bacterium]|nr:MAG: hypothetical protein CSA26_07830 [Desulfobacterales bacterium]
MTKLVTIPKTIHSSIIWHSCKLTVLGVLLSFSAFSAAAPAAEETAEQVITRLQDHYHRVDSLSFLFFQTTRGQMTGRPKKGSGNGVFVRTPQGSQMRWNYTSPERQVIISDGKQVTMYFERLNQMIIAPVTQAQADVFLSFFSDQDRLKDRFTIRDPAPAASADITDDLKVVHLLPNAPDSQISTIHIWVSRDSHIRRIELVDHFETVTTITLSEIQTDTISGNDTETIKRIFTFTPPEGTEIIKQ